MLETIELRKVVMRFTTSQRKCDCKRFCSLSRINQRKYVYTFLFYATGLDLFCWWLVFNSFTLCFILLISKKFDYQPRAKIIIKEKQASTFGNNAELFEEQCEDWVWLTQTHILTENVSYHRVVSTRWLQSSLLGPCHSLGACLTSVIWINN